MDCTVGVMRSPAFDEIADIRAARVRKNDGFRLLSSACAMLCEGCRAPKVINGGFQDRWLLCAALALSSSQTNSPPCGFPLWHKGHDSQKRAVLHADHRITA